MRFSQRNGFTAIRESLQIDYIDEPLENLIWNNILNDLLYRLDPTLSFFNTSERSDFLRKAWTIFFANRVDEIPRKSEMVVLYIKQWFFGSEWFEKYDFIEFLSSLAQHDLKLHFEKSCNDSLRKEMSAYRLISSNILQVTAEEELVEIESAVNNPSGWEPVTIHMQSAIALFSNRENPDYRNTIKESMCAVEALCKIMVNNKSATLGAALDEIEKTHKIHGALKKAFSSLYGYTSGAGGIRHALLEDDIEVTFEDAKFMLVSCSAFINYLKAKVNV